MADSFNKEKRSWIMSRIKSKNTKPELAVRKFLHANGYRYRIHVTKLPGRPDIVLSKYKTIIFVNGCFWHGHIGCPKGRLPKTKTEWWKNKIENNCNKDADQQKKLKNLGWNVTTIWQCELKPEKIKSTFQNLINTLNIQTIE